MHKTIAVDWACQSVTDSKYCSVVKSVMSQKNEIVKLWDMMKYFKRALEKRLLAKNELLVATCGGEIGALIF